MSLHAYKMKSLADKQQELADKAGRPVKVKKTVKKETPKKTVVKDVKTK